VAAAASKGSGAGSERGRQGAREATMG